MKLKTANAALLSLCVLLLAVLTGEIPLSAAADAAETVSRDISDLNETPRPSPADDGEPAPAEPPASEEVSPPSEAADTSSGGEPQAPRLAATTLVAEELLDNHTDYDADPDSLLEEPLSLTLPAEGYQILILHTHATEAYTPEQDDPYVSDGEYRTVDPDHNVIRVGEELAAVLTDAGLNVLHDATLHDDPCYSGSYARSEATVTSYLAAYPTIRVVIDLHRDALGDEETIYKTLADIDGLEAAQLMFVMGTDENLDHPLWRENLKLALALQARVRERFPTLMRPVALCGYRYNQQLSPGCLLLEVGTAGNTLAEALTAVRLFGEIAGPFLAGLVAE